MMRIAYSLSIYLLTNVCIAQGSYQIGILPSLNINKKLPNDFGLNFRLESRQRFRNGIFAGSGDFNYNYVLTDFSTIFSKKIAINKSITVGHLIRLREGQLINRTIQQFIINQKYARLRLAHRFSSDQTFALNFDTEFRLRYRLSVVIPLNGDAVDPKEFYFKINHEYLTAWQDGTFDLEIRLIPFLGFEFSETMKLESGLDCRVNSFLNGDSDSRFWIGVNWYQKF